MQVCGLGGAAHGGAWYCAGGDRVHRHLESTMVSFTMKLEWDMLCLGRLVDTEDIWIGNLSSELATNRMI